MTTLLLTFSSSSQLLRFLCREYDPTLCAFPDYWEEQSEELWKNLYTQLISNEDTQPNADSSWKIQLEQAIAEIRKPLQHDTLTAKLFYTSINKNWIQLFTHLITEFPASGAIRRGCLKQIARLNVFPYLEAFMKIGITELHAMVENPVCIVTEEGNLDMVKQLLACDPTLLYWTPPPKENYNELTPIQTAVAEGKVNIVEYLIDQLLALTEPEIREKQLDSTLPYLAVKECIAPVALSLLTLFITKLPSLPLHSALLSATRNINKEEDCLMLLQFLTEQGAQIEVIPDKKTALHYAAKKGYVSCVKYLLSLSSSNKDIVDAVDSNGDTALMLAACKDDQKNKITYQHIVTLLIQAGADVRKADKDSTTPLYYMALHVPSSLAQVQDNTLREVVVLGKTIENGFTVLHVLARSWYTTQSILHDVLQRSGLDVNVRDGLGNTPLHILSQSVSMSRLDNGMLIDGIRARTNTKNNVRAEEDDIIRCFLQAGARRDARNQQGLTPADLCSVAWIKKLLSPSSTDPSSSTHSTPVSLPANVSVHCIAPESTMSNCYVVGNSASLIHVNVGSENQNIDWSDMARRICERKFGTP